MVQKHVTTNSFLSAAQNLNQRRCSASLQLEAIVERAVGICSRANAVQRRVVQQNNDLMPEFRRSANPNAATAKAV